MSYPDGPISSHRAVEMAGLVASSFLVLDLPEATAEERLAAGREVDQRVQAMPDLMRLGVRLAGGVSYLMLSLAALRPFGHVREDRRAVLVARLGGVSLPVVGEYIRLTRGLGLASVVEARTARRSDIS